MIATSLKITLDGIVGKDCEERINEQGVVYAQFPLIVHLKNPNTDKGEISQTFPITVKGKDADYALGKQNPHTRIRAGDRVIVSGEISPARNIIAIQNRIKDIKGAISSNDNVTANTLCDQLEDFLCSDNLNSKYPPLWLNVFVTPYHGWIEVVSRRVRTALADKLKESGVRQLFKHLPESEFNTLVVDTMMTVASSNQTGSANNNDMVHASVLLPDKPAAETTSTENIEKKALSTTPVFNAFDVDILLPKNRKEK